MIATITNNEFGFAVAGQNVWAAVGNPCFLRYSSLSSSFVRTGSVEIYKYNINSDAHDKKSVLYRPLTPDEILLLSTELADILHTEPTGSIPFTANLDLEVDLGTYFFPQEDAYGRAIDVQRDLLAVGNPYFRSQVVIGTSSYSFTGSGYVDIFDLSRLNIDPYADRLPPTITGYSVVGGFINVNVSVPGGQNYGFVQLQSKDTLPDEYQAVNSVAVSGEGGNIVIPTNFTVVPAFWRVVGILTTNPYLTTVYNPHNVVTESFGSSVSFNDEWLAVGSNFESSSRGSVFMFRKNGGSAGNNASWSFFQSLRLPSGIGPGDMFGSSVCMNKATSSFSASLVVGTSKPSSSRAYVYEFNSGSNNWSQSFTLAPDNNTVYPLHFYPTLPVISGSFPNTVDMFGHDVSIFMDTVVVGAPTDRSYYQYSGSSVAYQGAAYFFERCANRNRGYYLARKSYGNEHTMKDNLLGWAVSVWDKYAVVGCPKTIANAMNICYIRGATFQEHYCEDDFENVLQGQYVLYQKSTGSIPDTTNIDWDIVNVYQVKKHLLTPPRSYGFDVNISEQFIVVGAPMRISGSIRTMNMDSNVGSFTGSLTNIDDLTGKAYIYNLKNLKPQFYVGNVFYRNGKLVVMTSGSAFQGLLLNNNPIDQYEYEMDFKSKQIVFEKQIVCPVDIGEFNVSTNPTAIVLPSSSFDVNNNGKFDFQDADVLLRYMMYKNTEASGHPMTDWSSSIINTVTDEEPSVYNMYSSLYKGTDVLFTSSYSQINNTMFNDLDFNEDNKIDTNDINILWKYFINRLTQKNYETYITPNSNKKFLSDIIDFLNERTKRNVPSQIDTDFLDYGRLTRIDPTGSYLAPYVTTIGLYDGAELVAVAKLGSPIKITPDFPINFVVKMDF